MINSGDILQIRSILIRGEFAMSSTATPPMVTSPPSHTAVTLPCPPRMCCYCYFPPKYLWKHGINLFLKEINRERKINKTQVNSIRRAKKAERMIIHPRKDDHSLTGADQHWGKGHQARDNLMISPRSTNAHPPSIQWSPFQPPSHSFSHSWVLAGRVGASLVEIDKKWATLSA